MKISEYISKEIPALTLNSSIKEAKELFNSLTFSHFPIVEENHLIGSITESDVRTVEDDNSKISEHKGLLEDFYCRSTDNWMEVLKKFSASETNILPVLDKNNKYAGYFELIEILHYFNDTPLLNNDGFFLVIEKGINDYSFSEIAQIVESSSAKLLGMFISGYENGFAKITLKIHSEDINEIIQSFRRYDYNLLTKHKEDLYLEELKERSEYLQKYLKM